jgi:hypothetical protein
MVKKDKTDTVEDTFNKKILEELIAETKAYIEKLDKIEEHGTGQSEGTETVISKLNQRLNDYEKKLKVIDQRLVPKTDAERAKEREDLENAQKDLENQYAKLRAELKAIEAKKTELALTPEELADLKKLDEGFDEAQADLREVEKVLTIKTQIPAMNAAQALQGALNYFSKLYNICSSTVLMREKYEPEGVVYASEEVEAGEKEDVPLTLDEMEHSLLMKRDQIGKLCWRFSGLSIKAVAKIKSYYTTLKSELKKYIEILKEFKTESVSTAKTADEERVKL